MGTDQVPSGSTRHQANRVGTSEVLRRVLRNYWIALFREECRVVDRYLRAFPPTSIRAEWDSDNLLMEKIPPRDRTTNKGG
jgi:hypothetical protein